MFTDESHIFSCLRYNQHVQSLGTYVQSIGRITRSSLRENKVLLTSCSMKVDFTYLHIILFLRV